jgi:hypothetical protein
MVGRSKGTKAASLGAEWGGGDGRRQRKMAATQLGSGEAGGRG